MRLDHVTLYRDPRFFAAFPSVSVLPSGEVLVLFRRARDRRRLLVDWNPALDRHDHLDARSHLVLLRLSPALQHLGAPEMLPPDPEAGDQDANLLVLRDGGLLVSGFCWYPLAPGDAPPLQQVGAPVLGGAAEGWYLFWGGYTRRRAAGATTWEDHAFLPPIPGVTDILPGRRPHHGGAQRGRSLELPDGRLLLASYAPGPSGRRGSHLFVSRDGGAAWHYGGPIAADPAACLVEPALQRDAAGRLIAFHRTDGHADRLATAESLDDGATWSPRRLHDVVGHPYDALALPDGRFLLVYGYRHRPFGVRARLYDPRRQLPEAAPELVLRDDAAGPDVGYPWAALLPDGAILVVYYFVGADGVRGIEATRLDW